jgi:radical SAM superfamily enzyme YgiQ (UPF0313 family)
MRQKSRPQQEIDVLLTYPADPIRVFDSLIPLGLASIAAVLEQNSYKVKVIDFNHYARDFRADLAGWNPAIVGIGGTTATRKAGFLTARLTKEVLPAAAVVYGGVHASFTARDTLSRVPFIDYVVQGEGEFPFLALCNRFVRHHAVDIATLPGLCYRADGGTVENRPDRIDNLDRLPLPARHLFEGTYRLTLDFFDTPADFLLTSRGCPAHCTFCSASRMFPGGVRYRSMDHIKREIDGLISSKSIKALKLFDSTFTSSREHVLAFCDCVRPYDMLWECEARADTVDRGILRAMRRAGCAYVNVGLETANSRLLARTAKNIRTEQAEACLAWCRELGIRTKLFMLFGHPGQTYNDCTADVRYIRKNRDQIDFYATTVGMRVYPGTALEASLKKSGGIPRDFSWALFKAPLKNWLLFDPTDVLIVDQQGLNFFHLFRVLLLLAQQRTLTSRAYLCKMVAINAKVRLDWVLLSVVHLRHRVLRALAHLSRNSARPAAGSFRARISP